MAGFFFGFDTTNASGGLEDALDCLLEDEDLGEEEEYDALNDETFGSEATIGDWEKDHEKLAEITESSRPHHQNTPSKKPSGQVSTSGARAERTRSSCLQLQNGIYVDIEDNLSHLVLDEKEGIVPRPGVWDSPPNLSLPKPRAPLSLPPALTNVRTVEELEKGLVANRSPPGLVKPLQARQQAKSEGSHAFENLPAPPRFPPGLGIPAPHHVVLPPNMRFSHPQFVQHPRLLPNQSGSVRRYYVPPHLMMPPPPPPPPTHGAQRQPLHGSLCGNFPQPPPHSNIGPPPFLRPDHGMMPPFSGTQNNHHHQQQQQQQQQQHHHHHHQHHSFAQSGSQINPNKTFHSGGEQQGNHQPFFKNNQYPRNYDRNNQRQYLYHQQNSPGLNGMNCSGEYDEYAGLMSSREKQWLINIQLLQLNTNEPYVDDYYYTVFCDRRNKQTANQDQKDKKHHNNNGYHRNSRDREQSHHVLTRVIYAPAQFENSLGKLQCVSVTAPRKVIDMDVVPNSDPQSATQLQQKDTKKTRQLLLEIERLYVIQLKLEDLHNALALLTDQRNHEDENDTTAVKKTSPQLISMILSSLFQLVQDDKLASMLSIRKGKMLILRFLSYLNVEEYRTQLEELWTAIFRGLAVIGRRDSHLLTSLYSEFRRWFDTVRDFDTILGLAKALSDSASQPIKNNSLAFALANKFGVSVIASMLEQAEKLYPAENYSSSEWSSFVVNIVEVAGESTPSVAPCQPIAASTLNLHLSRISNLKIERYTTLELLLTDANPSR